MSAGEKVMRKVVSPLSCWIPTDMTLERVVGLRLNFYEYSGSEQAPCRQRLIM